MPLAKLDTLLAQYRVNGTVPVSRYAAVKPLGKVLDRSLGRN